MSRPALATTIGDVELSSAVMTASGTAGYGAELSAYGDLSALGALVTKSLAATPWPGNAAPRVTEVRAGMLNSVGLQGPGVPAWRDRELPAARAAGATVVASIWGTSVDAYRAAAEALEGADVAAVEVNVSCPNVEDRSSMFAHSAAATVAEHRATSAQIEFHAEQSVRQHERGGSGINCCRSDGGEICHVRAQLDPERMRAATGLDDGTGGCCGMSEHRGAVFDVGARAVSYTHLTLPTKRIV